MKVNGKECRTVWVDAEAAKQTANPASAGRGFPISMIDQRRLPHEFVIIQIPDHRATADAIRNMTVRGAPAIGATAAFGLAQVVAEAPVGEGREAYIKEGHDLLWAARPTAQDLFAALTEIRLAIESVDPGNPAEQAGAALAAAHHLSDRSVERCRKIGEAGAPLIEHGMTVMTHCNAGWLACVDWGTALAPIYVAHREGRKPRVIASETRPRLQGANLTAWELGQEGVDCRIAADGATGILMARAEVDLVITGADRVAANGDAANKVGTYGKALMAYEHGIPFYIAAPASTFDLDCPSGTHIPIEERPADELLFAHGRADDGTLERVRIAPEGANACNPAFDVTPAKLIAGLITEHGIIEANEAAIAKNFGPKNAP